MSRKTPVDLDLGVVDELYDVAAAAPASPQDFAHTSVGRVEVLVRNGELGAPEDDRPYNRSSRKTMMVLHRLANNPHYRDSEAVEALWAKYGFLRDKHVIGFGTPIGGGVYLGQVAREALYVPTAPDSVTHQLYRELVARNFTDLPLLQTRSLDVALLLIYAFVQEHMPFDKRADKEIAATHGVGPDEEISLDVYVEEGCGVCRHQGCLYARLLELLQADKYLPGTVTMQRRNFFIFGHAWVRAIFDERRYAIIDLAMKEFGWLSEMSPENREFYGVHS